MQVMNRPKKVRSHQDQCHPCPFLLFFFTHTDCRIPEWTVHLPMSQSFFHQIFSPISQSQRRPKPSKRAAGRNELRHFRHGRHSPPPPMCEPASQPSNQSPSAAAQKDPTVILFCCDANEKCCPEKGIGPPQPVVGKWLEDGRC